MNPFQSCVSKARELIQRGLLQDALECLNLGLLEFGNIPPLLITKYQVLKLQEGLHDENVDQLQSLFPDNPRVLLFVMEYRLSNGRYSEAEEVLTQGMQLDGKRNLVIDVQAKMQIAFAMETQNYEKVIEYCDDYLNEHPNDPYMQRKLVIGLSRLKDVESLDRLEEMLRKYSNMDEIHPIFELICILSQRFSTLYNKMKSQGGVLEIKQKINFLLCLQYLQVDMDRQNSLIDELLTPDIRLRDLRSLTTNSLYDYKLSEQLILFFETNPKWKQYSFVNNYIRLYDLNKRYTTSIADSTETIRHPLDLVFSWIDLNDPELLKKFEMQFGYSPKDSDDKQTGMLRFEDNDEIVLALKSVQKHLEWANNIFIITHGQSFDLSFLNPNFASKIKFINQSDLILDEWVTGDVFHSNLVETFMYRIPGLSKYFLYLCDDMAFSDDLVYEDFFSAQNLPFAFLKSVPPSYYENLELLYDYQQHKSPPWKSGRKNALAIFNRTEKDPGHYDSIHQGLLLDREIFKEIVEQHADEWKNEFFKELARGPKAVFTPLLVTLESLRRGRQVMPEPNKPFYSSRSFGLGLHNDALQYIRSAKSKFYCLNYIVDKESRKNLQELIAQ